MVSFIKGYICTAFFLLALAGRISGTDCCTVNITGDAPGYAGEEIVFYRWTDQISFTETELFTVVPDSNGEFSARIEVCDAPLYIFSNTGIYYIYMYIESGSDYRVVLPEKTDKSLREELNPYFEGIPTHIAVLNHDSTELNSLIRSFDEMYEPLFGEPFMRLTTGGDTDILDSISTVFDRHFSDAGHPYFNDYRSYKMALFRIMAQMESARTLSDTYFRSEPVKYRNVAYMEVFNQVYNRYFLFFSRTVKGGRIFDDINKRQSLTDLRNTLSTDPVLGDERLLEMVILKGLHDAFYGSDFSRSGLLVVLDSLAAVTRYSEHVAIAENIREKVTRLMTGFRPPAFELRNREGEIVSLPHYRGDYVYLNFCMAASYGCLSEFDVLARLNENHDEYLRIVTIFVDESHQSMLEFLDKTGYDWDFLFYGDQPSILKEYDIRMFPTYYLIDRDGTLLMSPAPNPAENFEGYLLRVMRSRGEVK
ncbi:MAG: TlpA disulfide reductase family protein [Bacteroidales bacterium]